MSRVSASATKALTTPMHTAMRVTTRTRGLAVKSPRCASATVDIVEKFNRRQALFGVSPACDTPFWNGGLCGRGSRGVPSPARRDSARVPPPFPCRAFCSLPDAVPDLPRVVAAVNHVEAHPLLDREVAHARMLHEQIGASFGQERAVDLIRGGGAGG